MKNPFVTAREPNMKDMDFTAFILETEPAVHSCFTHDGGSVTSGSLTSPAAPNDIESDECRRRPIDTSPWNRVRYAERGTRGPNDTLHSLISYKEGAERSDATGTRFPRLML